ncbi:hypothetical protein, partial [Microbacterium sp. NPDC055357]
DRFSLTLARWLTNVYDEDNPAESSTTPGDVTEEREVRQTNIVLHAWQRPAFVRLILLDHAPCTTKCDK